MLVEKGMRSLNAVPPTAPRCDRFKRLTTVKPAVKIQRAEFHDTLVQTGGKAGGRDTGFASASFRYTRPLNYICRKRLHTRRRMLVNCSPEGMDPLTHIAIPSIARQFEKLPPHSIESRDVCLLASMMLDKDIVGRRSNRDREQFYLADHRSFTTRSVRLYEQIARSTP